jgi:rhodanese-related sulfurtransferase
MWKRWELAVCLRPRATVPQRRFFVLIVLLSLVAVPVHAYELLNAPDLAHWLTRAQDAPLVLDVRGPAEYRQGTLPGAVNAGSDPAGFLPPGDGQAIVLVLPQPADPAQLEAWQRRLTSAGHRVHVLAGGLSAWRRAGLAMETPVDSHARPGMVPFVVPRGICEHKEPAQTFR